LARLEWVAVALGGVGYGGTGFELARLELVAVALGCVGSGGTGFDLAHVPSDRLELVAEDFG
jgi:hypothetical protein